MSRRALLLPPGGTVAAGAYGSSTAVPVLTVGVDGKIIAASTATISAGVVGTSQQLTAPPTVANWSWTNQGSATATDQTGTIFLQDQLTGTSTISWRILRRALASAPYTYTVGIIPQPCITNYMAVGIGLRDSGTGKLVLMVREHNSNPSIGVVKYTNETTFSAWYSSNPYNFGDGGGIIWFQVSDNSTNRIWRVSLDGVNFLEVLSTTNTDFCTPDQICLVTESRNGAMKAGGLIVSYAVS